MEELFAAVHDELAVGAVLAAGLVLAADAMLDWAPAGCDVRSSWQYVSSAKHSPSEELELQMQANAKQPRLQLDVPGPQLQPVPPATLANRQQAHLAQSFV